LDTLKRARFGSALENLTDGRHIDIVVELGVCGCAVSVHHVALIHAVEGDERLEDDGCRVLVGDEAKAVVDAEEDIKWMLFEIKKLRNENIELKNFVETMRDQITAELKTKKK